MKRKTSRWSGQQEDEESPGAIASEVLDGLIGSGFKPERLDQLNDTLSLIGIVLGKMALLRVVTSPGADEKSVVSAARALIAGKEDPERLADRLRASSLSELSVSQLSEIVELIGDTKPSELDIKALIEKVKSE